MIYHIVTGDMAAAQVNAAIAAEPSMEGKVLVVKDVLSLGPIRKEEGQKFSEMRSAYWNEVVQNDKNPVETDDMERLLEAVLELTKNEQAKAWIWCAPTPADICTYMWTLKYLGKLKGRLFIINIAGLPFLDENGKLFFPKSIGEISAKEVIKARKLARAVTPAEIELDAEEWDKLTSENSGIRTLEGSKKIVSHPEDHYDKQLMPFITSAYQKASKVINQLFAKSPVPTGDLFLAWRLRKMGENGTIHIQGEPAKGLKEFEVKLNDGTLLL